jgi:predicted phosphodiesterase
MGSLRIQSLPASSGRTYIIGDIHGCAEELEQLLDTIQPAPEDSILAVGDLINRGPDSARVLQLARLHGITPVIGNHEARFIAASRGKPRKYLRNGDARSFQQLDEVDFAWIRRWPHVIECANLNALIVHGGFAPFLEWQKNAPEVVTRIQVLTRKLVPAKRSEAPTGRPWADLWEGPQHVYYGHTPRAQVLLHPFATGLDTGCVYGGHLSAICLPEGQLFQVKARRQYLKSPAIAVR